MENSNDHYDSPWKEAIEHYFGEFINDLYFITLYGPFVTNLFQNPKNTAISGMREPQKHPPFH
jgi:hypothetical protein